MKSNYLIISAISLLIIFGFQTTKIVKKSDLLFGTYGVYDGAQYIQLEINKDHSFRYKNSTNPKNPIDVNGEWTQNGDMINLNNHKSKTKINTDWKLDKNCNCLKSRKGLEFTRICLISKK